VHRRFRLAWLGRTAALESSVPYILLYGIAAAAIAALITAVVVPFVARVGCSLQVLDIPGGRRDHTQPTPRLGGLAILCGVALGAVASAVIAWQRLALRPSRVELGALLVATAIVALTGLVEDVVGLRVGTKLLAQIVAASILVAAGWNFSVLGVPGGTAIRLGVLGPVVTVLWLVGVTNAINLLDGLDGLASGIVAIIAASMLVYAYLQRNPGSVILMAAVTGACLGFLPQNWAPAKIFMGDAGSFTLGFLLAAICVHSSIKASATVAILVPILALGLPVMDTLLVMAVRFVGRPHGGVAERFLAMFDADQRHVHHEMQRWVKNRRQVVTTLYLVTLTFCLLAMVVAYTKNTLAGSVLVVVELLVIVIMRSLGLTGAVRHPATEEPTVAANQLNGDPDSRRKNGASELRT
jgi:UDP-GlcNAc:undecaprenyl-phosphate GlcNAc-1-phosphate transferase